VPIEALRKALAQAKSRGACIGIEPFFFRQVARLYRDPKTAEAVLRLRLDTVLKKKCAGDLSRLVREFRSSDLRGSMMVPHEGRRFRVSLSAVSHHYRGSPELAVRDYFRATGRLELAKRLSPLHFPRTSSERSIDLPVLEETMLRRFDEIRIAAHAGDYRSFCRSAKKNELFAPFWETIDGVPLLVNLAPLETHFQGSSTLALKRYLELRGQFDLARDFSELLREERRRGFLELPGERARMITAMGDAILYEHFHGDIPAMICQTAQRHLSAPISVPFGGASAEVGTTNLFENSLQASPSRFVVEYLQARGMEDLARKLRPYHFAKSPQGAGQSVKLRDEILTKKVLSLLSERFQGRYDHLMNGATRALLREPFQDSVAGYSLRVSAVRMAGSLGDSPFRILARFHKICGLPFPFERWHFSRSGALRAARMHEPLRTIATSNGRALAKLSQALRSS
jgi:hypothetical protein